MNASHLLRVLGGTALALTLVAVAAPAATGSVAEAEATVAADLHFELRSSVPMADSTVAPPTSVILTFTQKPQDGATQIRVMKGENRVPSGDVTQNAEDDKQHSISFERPLSPGAYTVMWRSMAADGHAVGGEFGFTVAAPGA